MWVGDSAEVQTQAWYTVNIQSLFQLRLSQRYTNYFFILFGLI